MTQKTRQARHKAAIEKEWKSMERAENRLCRIASDAKSDSPGWLQNLENKVPDKLRTSLTKAFCTAFTIIFENGTGIIEKGYNRQKIQEDLQIQSYAFQVRADRKSLKQISSGARSADLKNMILTTAEGIGLGALGVGLPDIVLFIGVLLKGIYETALHYGFSYDSPEEQYLILRLIETSVQKGDAFTAGNGEINRLLPDGTDHITPELLKQQITRTADAIAADMIVLKFLQGLPVIGVIGGTGNPVYYRRVMRYVRIKYQRRYLSGLAPRDVP